MTKPILNSNLLQHYKICDFLYHEGPLLSLYRDAEGRLFFYKWCDVDQNFNKWMVVYINPEAMKQFFSGEKTLRDCILLSEVSLMITVDKDMRIQKEVKVVWLKKEVSNDELPGENSYFDEEYTEEAGIVSRFFMDTMMIKEATKKENPFINLTQGQTITESIIYLA